MADGTISSDVVHLEQVRAWFGRPLWEMEPADADAYFGKVLRDAAKGTRLARAQALKTYFLFLELRHKVGLHQLTGRIVECPIDELNRPRGRRDGALRIPPAAAQVEGLFAGWRGELVTCRKLAPTARNYATARLLAEVGLRVNEACNLDLADVKWELADVKWELGRFGKLHVRHGKGARGSGPRERMVPLINGAGRTLRWFVEDVWGHFGDDHTRPGAPLLPSERKNADGSAGRVGDEALRVALAEAAATYLPDWQGTVTPHVLRHFCASQLYLHGMDLLAIQEILGHAWVATTMASARARAPHPRRGRLDRGAATRRRTTEGAHAMRWNLRLAAANRGIWKASDVDQAVQTATTPAARLILALAAVHAARSGAIRAMRLDDIDIGNRRLVIAGRVRPRDDLTRHVLLAWLEERHTRWPNTANPHLLVNQQTATETGPVSTFWAKTALRGQAATLERLRMDPTRSTWPSCSAWTPRPRSATQRPRADFWGHALNSPPSKTPLKGLKGEAMSQSRDRRRSALTALLVLLAVTVLGLLVMACLFILPATIVHQTGQASGTDAASTLTPAERLNAENDIRATLLQGLGGLLALSGLAAGAYISLRQVRVHREGQFIDRFTNAIEHMASDQISVRQGGIYAMEQIAETAPSYRGHIAALLTAFLRQHAPWPPTRPLAEVEAERQRFHGGLADAGFPSSPGRSE